MDVEEVPCRTGKLATWHLQLFASSTAYKCGDFVGIYLSSTKMDGWKALGAVSCTSCSDEDVSLRMTIAKPSLLLYWKRRQ